MSDACKAQHRAGFLREQKQRLQNELEELKEGTRGTVRAIAGACGDPPADDLDRAVANGHQAMAVMLANDSHMRLEAVLAAFEKFDQGQYGLCERCSREIGCARLKAMPAARYCRDCQEILEAAARRQGSPAVPELASD